MKKIWWIILAALIVLGYAHKYPVIVATILILSVALAVIIAIIKKKEKQAQEESLLIEKQRQELEHKAEMDKIHREIEARTKQFKDELDAIPHASFSVSQPVPRQYLKDMPEYAFSNITAKTKLSAIFPLVVLDVETTGIKPSSCEIIEVSAIKFDVGMRPIACLSTLCRPKHLIPPEASAINHITDDMVEDAPSFRQIAPALSEFIKGCNLVGHNLEFDLQFVYVHGTELPFDKRFYDTLEIAQHTIKRSDIDNHKLETLCRWYGIYRDDAHRSLSDCYATAKIFTYLTFDRTSRELENEAAG